MTTIRSIAEVIPRLRRRVDRLLHPRAQLIDTSPVMGILPGALVFRCNVCSSTCAIQCDDLEREGGYCVVCDSNMRSRSVVHHLSSRLFGRSLAIADFPSDASRLSGIGMSDTGRYAELLPGKMKYTNTFYHKAPRLDIQSPGREHVAAHDFAISSDVFEHVAPPVAGAFSNLRSLLKPGGVLVLTVPFSLDSDTVEHFPELYEFRIEEHGGVPVLLNRTTDGQSQRFTDLIFHGGPGTTLEMRLFSEAGLRRELEHAGFRDVTFHREPSFQAGIYWKWPWSVPITAIA